MVLDPIALKYLGLAVVAMDWTGHRNGPFRVKQPPAFVRRDSEIVCDLLELLAGHVEHRTAVDRFAHRTVLAALLVPAADSTPLRPAGNSTEEAQPRRMPIPLKSGLAAFQSLLDPLI